MKATDLTPSSTLRGTLLGMLVLAALVVLAPREAGADVVVRAKVGPVKVAVGPTPALRLGCAARPGLVLRGTGPRGHRCHQDRCCPKHHKMLKLKPRRGIWIKGHYEIRRHEGKVWIPGHWSEGRPDQPRRLR